MQVPQTPLLLAIIICDAAHRDSGTRKWTLIGTFNRVTLQQFPGRFSRMVIYIAVTEVVGHLPMVVRIIDTDEQRDPIFCHRGELSSSSPLDVCELTFVIDNIPFPQPGEYRIQVLVAEEMIGERKIFVGK